MLHDNEIYMNLEHIDKEKFLEDSINNVYFPSGHTTAYRSKFIKQILPSGFFYDEWTAICAGATGKIASINKRLVWFRRHKDACSSTSGGGSKSRFLEVLLHMSYDKYFGFPQLSGEAYKRYIELYGDVLPKKHFNDINLRINFHFGWEGIKGKNLLKREYMLYKLFKTEGYSRWRGNRNTFIMDFLYLLINKR